ncbi:F-box/kelch-repeat protein At3g06240-like [Papaver somniferum]|uniref:F-box/kelch-repeat protein At3g06240-like n=1 Tax=Papaver somniferum TaxID=3469 RepID=UPI000E6F57F6|nr:F-box/kelch-repeat protein At3g06240-like [Papaver somniferum]
MQCGGGGDHGHLILGTPTIIFNPVTREFVRLHGTNANIQGLHISVAAGFGYHHSTNEYKVVRIYDEYIGNVLQLRKRVRKVQVYTLGGGGGWRYIGNVRYTFYFPGINANGSLYWVDYSTGGKIIAFDSRDEEFQSISTPPQISISLNSQCTTILSFRLRVLGGHLCLVHQKPGICVDIWSLKKKKRTNSNGCSVQSDKGNFWLWTKEFSITWEASFRDYDLITITKSNVVLLRCNFTTLYCYDLKTELLSKLWKDDANSTIFDATPHTNSCISLKDLGEKIL